MSKCKLYKLEIVVVVVLLITVFAPIIFTSFSIVDFTNTGQIGDTIGGTTAPFLGFLSVWLLYLTFKEQHNFNKEQLAFNKQQQVEFDTTYLTKLQCRISKLSNELKINIFSNGQPHTKYGTSYLELLRKGTNPNNRISDIEFDNLYKGVVEIAELCILFDNIIKTSAIDDNLKTAFVSTVKIHKEGIFKLFCLYKSKDIVIDLQKTDLDFFWERYKYANDMFLKVLYNSASC